MDLHEGLLGFCEIYPRIKVLFLAFCYLEINNMKFLIGYKQEMTQQYRDDGTVVPVTIVKAEPIVITQVKTAEKEGYNAVQVGIGEKKKIIRSQKGHLNAILASGRKPFKELQEYRVDDASKFKVGDSIDVGVFQPGDIVNVSGVSKGKGFQGVVKRHGFHGAPASHGHKDQLRMPGSIGSQDPQRVFKGMKMGGRMGTDAVTVKNLEIIKVDAPGNLIYVKGALPGARNSVVRIFGAGDFDVSSNLFEAKKETAKAEKSEQEVEENPKKENTEQTESPQDDKKEEKSPENKSDKAQKSPEQPKKE